MAKEMVNIINENEYVDILQQAVAVIRTASNVTLARDKIYWR